VSAVIGIFNAKWFAGSLFDSILGFNTEEYPPKDIRMNDSDIKIVFIGKILFF